MLGGRRQAGTRVHGTQFCSGPSPPALIRGQRVRTRPPDRRMVRPQGKVLLCGGRVPRAGRVPARGLWRREMSPGWVTGWQRAQGPG